MNISNFKSILTLLNQAIVTGVSAAIASPIGSKTLKASITGTGAVSSTIQIYGNNDNSNSTGVLLMTITLSGTNSAVDGSVLTAEWPYLYANITAISGTSAAVTVNLGV